MLRPTAFLFVLCVWLQGAAAQHGGAVRAAAFRIDATPPLGSPLCHGAVPPARRIADPLSARGVVLVAGHARPIVLCAVDWVGIGNAGHLAWREALAEAAGTTPARVAVHTVHQHDAPGSDFAAEELLESHGLGGRMIPAAFCRQTIARAATAVRQAMRRLRPVTHVGYGRGRVEKVASNRRVLGPNGKVRWVRYSKCTIPEAVAAPEGTIDPFARVVTLYENERPLVVLSYYATHPQSYYGRGEVSADFVGMARDAVEREHAGAVWIHFDGAGGNVAAGKYNDGSEERRPILAARLASGLRAAFADQTRVPLGAADVAWRCRRVWLPPSPHLRPDALRATLANPRASLRERIRAARDLTWLRWSKRGTDISCLVLGPVEILHLPGELFVEYQLAAQQARPHAFVCMAAYGDYGPGYLGTEISYRQGGYETGRPSRVAPAVEKVLLEVIRNGARGWRAGVARAWITPRAPIWLAGYAKRRAPSRGVLDDLWAKALALEDAHGARALLVTADLLGLPRRLAERVAARLARRLRLPREAIVLATSHTHSGPVLARHLEPTYDLDRAQRRRVAAYTRWLEDELVELGGRAFAEMAPADLAFTTGRCDFAVNRRANPEREVPERRARGTLQGPVDPTVPVLAVRDPEGGLRAVVAGYACHATVLDGLMVSGDYPGAFQRALERSFPGVTALFVAGCGGDQNPIPRRSEALARRYGERLAGAVQKALRGPMQGLAPRLRARMAVLDLPFEHVPDHAELRERLRGDNPFERRRAALLLARGVPATYPYPVQVLGLGQLTLVALGGEVVVDYALRLRSEPGGTLWVAAYCNDVMGYVPSRRVWEEGGYEGGGAMLYYGLPSRWAGDVETRIVGAVSRLVHAIRAPALRSPRRAETPP